METQAATPTASGAASGPAVYAKATAMRRSGDGGVALGLFSKIAAARKEQLAPYVRCGLVSFMQTRTLDTHLLRVLDQPSAASGSGHSPSDTRRASSHFPEIHEATAARSTRTPPITARKVITSRTFAQNLRLAKHGFPEESSPQQQQQPHQSATARRSQPAMSLLQTMDPSPLQASVQPLPQPQRRPPTLDFVRGLLPTTLSRSLPAHSLSLVAGANADVPQRPTAASARSDHAASHRRRRACCTGA